MVRTPIEKNSVSVRTRLAAHGEALQKPNRRSHPNPRSRRLGNPGQLRRRERYRPTSSFERVKIGRRSWVKFGSRLTPIIEGCGPVTARYCDPDGNKLDRPQLGCRKGATEESL